MAKTRRVKRNTSPRKNQQITLVVVEEGSRYAARKDNEAKPVFLGRVYTGINKGKVYPYASTKRGGGAALKAVPKRRVSV